jgi:hypothetical protein
LAHEKCIVWYIYLVKSVVIDLKYKILLISNLDNLDLYSEPFVLGTPTL